MSDPNTARTSPRSGWYGFVAFAGIMMILLGAFHVMAGLVALLNDEYFLVDSSGLVVTADFTAWGWIHLIVGILLASAGGSLFAGRTWARAVAIVVAMFSAIVNLAFLSAYPVWSAMMILVDILVIYAVTVHAGEPSDRV